MNLLTLTISSTVWSVSPWASLSLHFGRLAIGWIASGRLQRQSPGSRVRGGVTLRPLALHVPASASTPRHTVSSTPTAPLTTTAVHGLLLALTRAWNTTVEGLLLDGTVVPGACSEFRSRSAVTCRVGRHTRPVSPLGAVFRLPSSCTTPSSHYSWNNDQHNCQNNQRFLLHCC